MVLINKAEAWETGEDNKEKKEKETKKLNTKLKQSP
jgi:hypothetical protein